MIPRVFHQAVLGTAFSATSMLMLIGCGGSSVPMSDPAAAKQLLESSLEAWKTGKSVADMRQLTPPVYVAEELWSSGFELQDFLIQGEGEMYGPNVRLNVTLTGSNKGRAVGKRQLQYLVTTAPACTIARVDR